jgi:DNA-binding MarR family transcriptional regulator
MLTKYNKPVDTVDLQNNLGWLFMATSLQVKKDFMRLAAEFDLPLIQVIALGFLEPGSPMPMKHMAYLLNCEPPNVSALIDRLFALKYVTREENLSDRRIKMISLTKTGEKERQRIVKGIISYHSERLDRLSAEEKVQFQAALGKIFA